MSDDLFKEDFWDRPDDEEVQEHEYMDASPEDFLYEGEEEEWGDDTLVDVDDEEFNDFMDGMEDDAESVMDNARIRLEQGRLYEMLIKHNLFDGVDAMPEAISKVEVEMKEFIMERLEILLGMKAEKETEVHIHKESQFNELEVQVLRRVASKMSKGMTEEVEPATREYVESKLNKNALNTVKKVEKKPKLNAMGNKKQKQPTPKPAAKKRKPKTRKVGKKVAKMVDTSTEGLSVSEIAKKDLEYGAMRGKLSLEQANELVEKRHNKPRKQLPTDAQSYQNNVNSQYSTKMSMNETASTFGVLLAAAQKKK